MDLKARIIDVASDLFINLGCKSVTMDDIANANGISKRTLYEHFRDKTHLLEEILSVMEMRLREIGEKMLNSKKNIVEIVCIEHTSQSDFVINLRIRFFEELKKFYPALHREAHKKFMEYHLYITGKFIEKGQEDGLFLKDLDRDIVSKMILEIASVLQNVDIFSLENHSRKELFRESLGLYLRGISTQEGIKLIDNYLNIEE